MTSSCNAFYNYNSAFHLLELEKTNFSKQAKGFEEKYNQEKMVRKNVEGKVTNRDKQIVKLKGKITELNKRTLDIKKTMVTDFKGWVG